MFNPISPGHDDFEIIDALESAEHEIEAEAQLLARWHDGDVCFDTVDEVFRVNGWYSQEGPFGDPPATGARDITRGIASNTFDGITDSQRYAIVTLLARVSERSYRRGFQQGTSLAGRRPWDVRENLHAWRYGYSLDDSPWADAPLIEPATERLFAENRGMSRLCLERRDLARLHHDPAYVASNRGLESRQRSDQEIRDAYNAEVFADARKMREAMGQNGGKNG